MTRSSDDTAVAGQVLRTVSRLLGQEHLASTIDEPIERAAVRFQLPETLPQDQKQILALVAAFLRHVHHEAFPQGRQLSADQAQDEALAVLERLEGGTGRVGYYELLLRLSRSSAEDLPLALWRVSEWIKAQKHYEYRLWVLARHITWAPWTLKLALTRELLRRLSDYCPSEDLSLPAEFWVASLGDLVDMALSLDLLSPPDGIAPVPTETDAASGPHAPMWPAPEAWPAGEADERR
jgi:hypothetical protein